MWYSTGLYCFAGVMWYSTGLGRTGVAEERFGTLDLRE
jgi:hypothetical protein